MQHVSCVLKSQNNATTTTLDTRNMYNCMLYMPACAEFPVRAHFFGLPAEFIVAVWYVTAGSRSVVVDR